MPLFEFSLVPGCPILFVDHDSIEQRHFPDLLNAVWQEPEFSSLQVPGQDRCRNAARPIFPTAGWLGHPLHAG